jgi:hypothetical protein
VDGSISLGFIKSSPIYEPTMNITVAETWREAANLKLSETR